MLVLSDRHDYAAELLPPSAARRLSSTSVHDPTAERLAREFLAPGPVHAVRLPDGPWRYLFLSHFAPASQYDRMIQLARGGPALPDRVVCVAGAGEGFHGFKGRSWAAAPGNLHLTVHFAPGRAVERFETAFTALAAVSVAAAVERVPGLEGRARIKWMNDILVEGEKVGGILAYTQSSESAVAAGILGIGLNVETAPEVERSPYVPAVGALRDHAPRAGGSLRRRVLLALLEELDRGYRVLLERGYAPLLERYRSRSDVVGREVVLRAEEPGPEPAVLAEGRVAALGDGLELFLEGRKEPFTRGRLIVRDAAGPEEPGLSGREEERVVSGEASSGGGS